MRLRNWSPLCLVRNQRTNWTLSGTITRTGTLALQGRVSKGNVVRRTKVRYRAEPLVAQESKHLVSSFAFPARVMFNIQTENSFFLKRVFIDDVLHTNPLIVSGWLFFFSPASQRLFIVLCTLLNRHLFTIRTLPTWLTNNTYNANNSYNKYHLQYRQVCNTLLYYNII